MIRGTTPTLEFTLPFELLNIKRLWITFSQNNKEMFTVEKDECEIKGSVITLTLSQRQSLLLCSSTMVEIQIRILTDKDESLASNIIKTPVQRILKDGVI